MLAKADILAALADTNAAWRNAVSSWGAGSVSTTVSHASGLWGARPRPTRQHGATTPSCAIRVRVRCLVRCLRPFATAILTSIRLSRRLQFPGVLYFFGHGYSWPTPRSTCPSPSSHLPGLSPLAIGSSRKPAGQQVAGVATAPTKDFTRSTPARSNFVPSSDAPVQCEDPDVPQRSGATPPPRPAIWPVECRPSVLSRR